MAGIAAHRFHRGVDHDGGAREYVGRHRTAQVHGAPFVHIHVVVVGRAGDAANAVAAQRERARDLLAEEAPGARQHRERRGGRRRGDRRALHHDALDGAPDVRRQHFVHGR